jgi:hypothetical protein
MFVDGIDSGLTAFHLVDKRRDQLLAQFVKQPTVKRDIDYYQSKITQVTSVDAFLKDRRLLTIALSAFQLEDQVDSKALIRKFLTQDPSDKNSLVNKMLDPRWVNFAKAFASLNSDQGATIQGQSHINSILGGYQTNQFEKATGETNPAVRQALYFERTVTDTIDVKNLNGLVTQFNKSDPVSSAVQYYRANIAKVHTPADLVADPKLLAVVLSAFHLDSLAGSTTKQVQSKGDGTANAIPVAFSFVSPGDLVVTQTDSSVTPPVGKVLKLGTDYTLAGTPDANGNYPNGASIVPAAARAATTQWTIQRTGTVDRLLTESLSANNEVEATGDASSNPIAFNLPFFKPNDVTVTQTDYSITPPRQTTLRRGLDYTIAGTPDADGNYTNGATIVPINDRPFGTTWTISRPESANPRPDTTFSTPGALAKADPRFLAFAQAFATLRVDGGASVGKAASVDAVVAAFQRNEFEKALSADAATQRRLLGGAGSDTVSAMRSAFQGQPIASRQIADFRAQIGSVNSPDALLAKPQLLAVALSAFNLDALATAPATVKALISQDPDAPGSLAHADPRYRHFAQAFAPLRSLGGRMTPQAAESVVAAFGANEFAKSLDPKVQKAASSTGTMTAVQFLGDNTLSAVTRAAFNLPDALGALDVNHQLTALTRAGFDPAKLQDPKALKAFIDRFLAASDRQNAAASGQSNPLLALFAPGGASTGGSATGSLGLVNLLV